MPNLPWFKLFPKDFLTDDFVLTATNEELGIYTRWICLEWINGGLPNDLAQLAVMGHTTEEQAAAILKRLRCKKKTKRDKILLNKLQEQREFRALQSTKGCKNRGKPKNTKGLQANRIETEREPNANRIETEREPNLNHKTSDTETEEKKGNPPPTPSQKRAKPPPEIPRLDDVWEQVKKTYPHPGNLRDAEVCWQIALTSEGDPEAWVSQVVASAAIAAEIYALDPTARRSRMLPNLATFLDGGWRENRAPALEALRSDGTGSMADKVAEFEKYMAEEAS